MRPAQEFVDTPYHWIIFYSRRSERLWDWECHREGTDPSKNIMGKSVHYDYVRPDAVKACLKARPKS